MNSWIILADVHLQLVDVLGRVEGNLNSRLKDKLIALRKVINFSVEKEVDFIIFLGDTMNMINPVERLRELFIQSLKPLIKHNITTFILTGNHESNLQSSNFASMERILETYRQGNRNLFFVNKVIFLDSEESPVKDCEIILTPAIYKEEKVREILKKIPNPKKSIVFGHWDTHEGIIGEDEYRFGKGIPCSMYEEFKRVYIGGFHKYQRYDNWMYPGSLCKKTFSERSDTKGFIYSRLENGEIIDEFIPVDDRKFIQIEINEVLPTMNEEVTKDAILKLHFSGSKTWYFGLDRNHFVKKYYEFGAHKVFTSFTNTETLESNTNKVTVSSNFNDDIKEFYTEKKKEELIKPTYKILEGV